MRKRYSLPLFLLALQASAQVPVLEWGHLLNGPGNLSNYINSCDAVTADPDGNVYVVGAFANNLDLIPGAGSYLVTSAGQTNFDLFLAKYDQLGQFIWGKQLVTGSVTFASWIDRQPNGDLVIAGYLAGTTDFDPGVGNVPLTGNGDMFFARYTDQGDLVWAKTIGSTSGVDALNAMAVDPLGNIWLAGSINDSIDLDPSAAEQWYLCTPASRDGFIAKYDPYGDFLWGHTFGNTWGDDAKALAFTPDGNTVLTGRFVTSMDAEPGAGTTTLSQLGTSEDVFVITYSPSGQLLDHFVFGGSASDMEPMGTAVDGEGNIFVIGEQYGNGGSFTPGQDLGSVNPGSNTWGWLAKYSAAGDLLWYDLFSMNGSNGPGMTRLCVDSDGDPHVLGASIAGFDADPGPGSFALSAGYVLKYANADGAFNWAVSTGSGNSQYLRGLYITANDDLLIAGGGNSTWSFNGSFLGSGNVAVLMKTGECLPPSVELQPYPVETCEGDYYDIHVIASGTAPHYQWFLDGDSVGLDAPDHVTGPLSLGTHTFQCIVTGLCGADTTAIATVEALPWPDPYISLIAGVLHSNEAGDSYVWELNGTPIPGATDSTYIPAQSGWYTVNVTILTCSETSDPFYCSPMGLTDYTKEHPGLVYDAEHMCLLVPGALASYGVLVLDAQGRSMRSFPAAHIDQLVDLSDLMPGIHFARCGPNVLRFMR